MAAMPSSRPTKAQVFVGGGLDADLAGIRRRAAAMFDFISLDMGKELGLLRDQGGVHIDHGPLRKRLLAGSLVQKDGARRAAPAGIGVRKEMADVGLSQRPQDGVANRVHQHVGIGVAFQTLAVRDFHAAKDELAPLDQGVNVVTNSNMNHPATIGEDWPNQSLVVSFKSVWTPSPARARLPSSLIICQLVP